MTDIVIRDVPEDVIAAIDIKARRLGLSRIDYVRRALARERSDDGLAIDKSALITPVAPNTAPVAM